MGKTALVIGATGLVGGALVRQLLDDARFDRVVTFARRPLPLSHPKLDAQVVDFRRPDDWAGQVKGDVLFSALGTTLKQAGSKQAQYEVDHTFQLQTAQRARENGVETLALVSSGGANERSRIFYPRMKGELERDVVALGFPRTRILRPGLLAGEREQKRLGEGLALVVSKALGNVPGLGLLRAISGEDVAHALVQAWAEEGPAVIRYEMKDVFALAERAKAGGAR